MLKRIISVILAVMMIFSLSSVYAKENVSDIIDDGVMWAKGVAGIYEGGFLSQRHLLPVGNTLSDWIALVFALNGEDDDYEGYLKDLEFYVSDCYEENGYLEAVKATEYHRIILTIYALGGDPTNFGKNADGNPVNLLADGTYNFHGDNLGLQGLNGWIFALISLDAKETTVPEGAKFTREDMINAILTNQEADGGFGLAAGSSNCDITAMAVQALSEYYDREDVKTAVDKALEFMSGQMNEDGRFTAFGEESSETVSQLIIALCSIGIDPENDERFIKGGKNLLQHAMSYRNDDGGFSHEYGSDVSDFMATQQMLLALTAVERLRDGEDSLYDFKNYDGPVITQKESKTDFPVLPAVIMAAGVVGIVSVITVRSRGKKNV